MFSRNQNDEEKKGRRHKVKQIQQILKRLMKRPTRNMKQNKCKHRKVCSIGTR